MKTNDKLVLAVLAGVAIGVAGATAIHAQQVKAPPAYVIAEFDVRDATKFQEYEEKVPATLAAFHGRYLVRGGEPQAVEGEAPESIVVIKFDSAEKARGWVGSPDYEAIKLNSSRKSRIFIAEGYEALLYERLQSEPGHRRLQSGQGHGSSEREKELSPAKRFIGRGTRPRSQAAERAADELRKSKAGKEGKK